MGIVITFREKKFPRLEIPSYLPGPGKSIKYRILKFFFDVKIWFDADLHFPWANLAILWYFLYLTLSVRSVWTFHHWTSPFDVQHSCVASRVRISGLIHPYSPVSHTQTYRIFPQCCKKKVPCPSSVIQVPKYLNSISCTISKLIFY